MKAVMWIGKHDVRVEEVPDPQILAPRDAIVKITSTAICGSDLHLYNGYVPTMKTGDILGHEFMGEVVEVGSEVKNLRVGDRIIVPFSIGCGGCFFCQQQTWSLCDNSNPNAGQNENAYGTSPCGIFGYSHLFGGYDGGQAQFARVPFADANHLKVPEGIEDEKVLFLTDVFATGWHAAVNAEISPGDVVAIWGGGPVGQMAAVSARILGADRILMIEREPIRQRMAVEHAGCEIIDFEEDDLFEAIYEMTGGRGPDVCIDAVGMEALGHGLGQVVDWTKQLMRMQSDRPNVLRQCITSCRKGGIVSIVGVYGGLIDSLNMGAAFNKSLTFRMGQTHVQKHAPALLQMILDGQVDPSFIITHTGSLEDAPTFYDTFKHREDDCVKCIMKPHAFLA